MPIIALPAHFNGERVCLDEAYKLEPNARLIVTVLPKEEADNEHETWLHVSSQTLSQAYGDNEPEYSPGMLKEVNPSYEAG